MSRGTLHTRTGLRLTGVAFAAALGLLATGCGDDQPTPPPPPPQVSGEAPSPSCPHCSRSDAVESAGKVDGAATPAAEGEAAVRSRYAQELDASLAAFQRKVDELAAATKHAAATGKDKLDAALVKLEQETAQAKAKLAELKAASGEKWQSLKAETSGLMSRLHRAYEAAASELKSDAPQAPAVPTAPTPPATGPGAM